MRNNCKVFTIKTVCGPQVVTAEMVGQLAIHPTLTADAGGVRLTRWTVSLPCGIAIGNFYYKELAQGAARFLVDWGIDWSLPTKELEQSTKARNDYKDVLETLFDSFGMRNGPHHYSDY